MRHPPQAPLRPADIPPACYIQDTPDVQADTRVLDRTLVALAVTLALLALGCASLVRFVLR